MTLMLLVFRYFSGFYAQEACHWRQEEGMEEEAKVIFSSCLIVLLISFAPYSVIYMLIISIMPSLIPQLLDLSFSPSTDLVTIAFHCNPNQK